MLRRAATAAVAAPMVLAPLALGTVHRGTRALVFGMCAGALLLALIERTRARRRITVAPPALPLALAVVATALQLVPLPEWLLAVVSPNAAQIGARTATLDPAATAGELAKLCAYLAFFLAVSIYCGRSQRRRGLLLVVVGSAAVVAAIGLFQVAVGARKILFFYTPESWNTFFGTFVNPNHFGGLMALAAPVALAWALSDARWRWPAFGLVVLFNACVVLSRGRISILACAAGQLAVLVLLRRQQSRGTLAVGFAALALGAMLLAARVRLAPDTSGFVAPSKVHVWEHALPLLAQYPLTGTGRGAFDPGFQQVSPTAGGVRFEWVENVVLQAPIDWGIPVGCAILAFAGWALWRGVLKRDREDPLATGALAGVFALGIHELADFSVELPGVALPALAVLSTLYFRRGETTGKSLVPRPVFWALPVVLILPLLAEMRLTTAAEDGAALAAVARNPLIRAERVIADGEAALRRHPADAYLPTVVAERLGRDRHPDALRWVNLAMERNPIHPIPHLMAAEVLADAGRKEQSLVEYRLAAAGAPFPQALVFPRVRARYPAVNDLIAATPGDPRGLDLLARFLLDVSAPADAETVYQRLVEIDPRNVAVRRQLVLLALNRRDMSQAVTRLRALEDLDQEPDTLRLAIHVRLQAGDLPAAVRLIDALGDRAPDTFDLQLSVADALSQAGAFANARARLDQLLGWQVDRTRRMRLHEIRAENERRAGNQHQYRWELQQRDRLQKH